MLNSCSLFKKEMTSVGSLDLTHYHFFADRIFWKHSATRKKFRYCRSWQSRQISTLSVGRFYLIDSHFFADSIFPFLLTFSLEAPMKNFPLSISWSGGKLAKCLSFCCILQIIGLSGRLYNLQTLEQPVSFLWDWFEFCWNYHNKKEDDNGWDHCGDIDTFLSTYTSTIYKIHIFLIIWDKAFNSFKKVTGDLVL